MYASFYGLNYTFDYSITENSDEYLVLVVSNPSGDSATYTNQNLQLQEIYQNDFRIYPNPVTDIVTLGNIDAFGKINVRIYDISGKLMINQNLDEKKTIDLSHLESGVYFMNVLDESNKIITTKKLIKK